ncbi:MAG: glycosyltransferase family 2 protein [Algicola sp.]|nr:glycosyltransferase family 2 protein [Algicola sp.]
MLSVLIPVYNYDIRLLVTTIHEQLTDSHMAFEICCMDDNSEKNISSLNSEISQLKFTHYYISEVNNGRVATRKSLASRAQYDWILFLDADVLPKSDSFIKNYITYLNSGYDAVYGGFAYQSEPPKANQMLRWSYGKSKEQVPAKIRNKTPYKVVISANYLIKKSVFNIITSQVSKRSYGYDNYFGAALKTNNYAVHHIDNEVYHFGLESSKDYLYKVRQSIETLLHIQSDTSLKANDNSLLKLFKLIKTWRINYLLSAMYPRLKAPITKNLLGKHPSIMLLQCYKLSYICYKDLNP